MINNNEVKYIQSFAHKKHWVKESVFIVEGPKMLEEVLASDWVVRKIFALPEWTQAQSSLSLEVVEVDEIMLGRLSLLQQPNKVLALVEKKKDNPSINFMGKSTLLLDGIQDPGNLGTIIRTADWFGVNQIITSEDTASWYNPKVIQSTMGSCFRVNIQTMNLETLLESNAHSKNKFPVYGALLKGKHLQDIHWEPTHCILIGNESKGIRENLIPYISQPITIAKLGNAESLNAAVATGIILAYAKN